MGVDQVGEPGLVQVIEHPALNGTERRADQRPEQRFVLRPTAIVQRLYIARRASEGDQVTLPMR